MKIKFMIIPNGPCPPRHHPHAAGPVATYWAQSCCPQDDIGHEARKSGRAAAVLRTPTATLDQPNQHYWRDDHEVNHR
jgi:hypothetical protein